MLVAPTGLDDHLAPRIVSERIAEGVRRVLPRARILEMPLPDGGTGFVDTMVDVLGGVLHHTEIDGPACTRIGARWGLVGSNGSRTAVIEVSSLAGGPSGPRRLPDPSSGTSEGVGQMIRAALDAGARRILLGGRSDVVLDGGLGMLQALGGRALDVEGHELGRGSLSKLHRLDLDGLDARLRDVSFEVAAHPNLRLLGSGGVARRWAQAHRIDRERAEALERHLARLANAIERATGRWVGGMAGGGASGGLSATVAGALGGALRPPHELTAPLLPLDAMVEYADLIVTADACLDEHSAHGGVPALLAQRAVGRRVPVIALGCCVSERASLGLPAGLEACVPLAPRACTAEELSRHARHWIASAAERAVRLLAMGRPLDLGPPPTGAGGGAAAPDAAD
ncbi:MAG: glycerate kinase [Ideonella sp.]|nr:glycerate kinase [Ideonella sp.]